MYSGMNGLFHFISSHVRQGQIFGASTATGIPFHACRPTHSEFRFRCLSTVVTLGT